MRIAVIGLGKIGLPLACQYASKGHHVIGVDINSVTVATINRGDEPFPAERGLDEALAREVGLGRLVATTDTDEAVSQADVVVVVVPLYVSASAIPDFASMDDATRAVGRSMKPGTLVSFETTLPIGTTRNRLTPLLEASSGLVAGRDFWVVFSPERVLTGRIFADLRRYPKLVGGIDPESEVRGAEFYDSVLDYDDRPDLVRSNGTWRMGSAEAAEFAKLAETTYRDVNIALANQFALHAESLGIDVHQVIAASNSQPFSHIHSPGIAVGGHCIPVYPQFYLWNDPTATVVRAAREANTQMPKHAVNRFAELFGSLEGARIAVLGAAYRGEVKELAFSGVFGVVDELRRNGATPLVHDPYFTDEELTSRGLDVFHRGDQASGLILQADHAIYREWTTSDVPGVSLVYDGRQCLHEANWPQVRFFRIGGHDLQEGLEATPPAKA